MACSPVTRPTPSIVVESALEELVKLAREARNRSDFQGIGAPSSLRLRNATTDPTLIRMKSALVERW